MSNHVITAVDVFADIDSTRPVAEIKRVGEGKFQVRLLTQNKEKIDEQTFESLEEAFIFADEISQLVDADPESPAYQTAVMSTLADKDAQIKKLEARIAELEAKEVKPLEVSAEEVKSLDGK